MKNRFLATTLALTLGAAASLPMFAAPKGDLSEQVRHQLVMLPYYSIFDDLSFKVDAGTGTVTLYGAVVWPVLRSDAQNAVKRLPGVTSVVNDIEVLPLSSFDNQIRRAEYRSIFSFGSLYRYAMGANPSIHIIVDNGHVTLVGVVANEGDKNIAFLRANGVPGVFSVTNNLRVAEKS